MAAFYLENAYLPTDHADKEVIRVMRRLGKDGNRMVNVATKDHVANLNCASTPGAYLWRPNTAQEAVGARNELDLMGTWSNLLIWTGANDIDQDGIFTFDIENGIFAPNAPPFGTGFAIGDPSAGPYCVAMALHEGIWTWYRRRCSGSDSTFSICEYPRRVCP
ncbi:Hypothetical predicted protein [Mytilus galloprovincialis]|uniref:C-type lectin domain-containing protein n=1 Tax=Mytilus galloprovincialis TaxID=29158 RepID=A0A8B6F7B8_MYTGA|nr:Hypothetical predicted protein [Mytilus galloprovincialis]